MVTCESAEALIVREADGLLAPDEIERLDRHAAGCAACRSMRQANLAVKAALAQRKDAEAPAGFVARVIARTEPEPEGWLAAVDWRRWTEWMVPVAAGLALVAALSGSSAPAGSSESGSEAVVADSSGDDTTSAAARALSQDVTSEELMAAMLGGEAGQAEGASRGR